MKKRNLKSLSLKKNIVSNLKSDEVKGAGSVFGCVSAVCSVTCPSNPIPGCFVRESELYTCDCAN
jgi:hypothetical protein